MKEPEKDIDHTYCVVLLPSEVVTCGLHIGEAAAWMETWNSIMLGGRRATIVEEKAAA